MYCDSLDELEIEDYEPDCRYLCVKCNVYKPDSFFEQNSCGAYTTTCRDCFVVEYSKLSELGFLKCNRCCIFFNEADYVFKKAGKDYYKSCVKCRECDLNRKNDQNKNCMIHEIIASII